jgi:conjugative transfer region protein (TIGR03748 family)
LFGYRELVRAISDLALYAEQNMNISKAYISWFLSRLMPVIVGTVAVFCGTAIAQPRPVIPMQQLARYTTAVLNPDAAQRDPLASTISVSLPRNAVTTVGDGVRYILLRTGYRLAEAQPPEVNELLALPIPEVHRQLGPYSVSEALGLLLGAGFSMDVDATRRQIAYRSLATSMPTAAASTPAGTASAVRSGEVTAAMATRQ